MKRNINSALVTSAQIRQLNKYEHRGSLSVDSVIDWLRRKYNIIVYNTAPPFVDPTKKETIVFSFSVKICNPKWGWNYREFIGKTKWSKNIYAMKRQAIWIAIRYLNKKQKYDKRK